MTSDIVERVGWTPGPWSVADSGEVIGPDNRPVAFAAASRMTGEDIHGRGPATANAALIAAAPDLLEALIKAEQMLKLKGYTPAVLKVHGISTAIAKATGASP